jgi:hypothetical protein
LARELFKRLPSLREKVVAYQHRYPGPDLLSAYEDDVLSKFHRGMARFPKSTVHLYLCFGTYNDNLEIDRSRGEGFGYVVPAEQSEVLRLFSREDQSRMATWQVYVPKVSEFENMQFVFTPESLMANREKYGGNFPSLGCSAGYGVNACTHQIKRIEDFRAGTMPEESAEFLLIQM